MICLYNNGLYHGNFSTATALATQIDAQDLVFCGSDQATSVPEEVCVWLEKWLSERTQI